VIFLSAGQKAVRAQNGDCWGECTSNGVATLRCIGCVFQRILSVILALVGLAVFVMLIVGGFQYLTAGDNPKGVEQAQKTLTSALIGLIVVIAAWLILKAIKAITGLNVTVFRLFSS
jgi:hypothetical protein